MSAATITETVLKRNTAAAMPSGTAVDSSDGLVIDMLGPDGKLLIILENDNAGANVIAKIMGGDGVMATESLSVTLADDAVKIVNVESGRYIQENGKLLIKGFAADGTTGTNKLKVSAVFLP